MGILERLKNLLKGSDGNKSRGTMNISVKEGDIVQITYENENSSYGCVMQVISDTKIKVYFKDEIKRDHILISGKYILRLPKYEGFTAIPVSVEQFIKERVGISVIFNIIGEMFKVEKRQFFRMRISLNVKYLFCDDTFAPNSFEGYKNTHTLDISGGGMRIRINDPLHEAQRHYGMLCILDIDHEAIEIGAKINRLEKKNEAFCEAVLFFEKITDKDRTKIINYIFKEQRKHIKALIESGSGDLGR